MDRRTVLKSFIYSLFPGLVLPQSLHRFRYCLIEHGNNWQVRKRALTNLSFEIEKRCNIPINSKFETCTPNRVLAVNSPFFILSGSGILPAITDDEALAMRTALNSGGLLLFDDFSVAGDTRFETSAKKIMKQIYPELEPDIVPPDHSIFQTYYLLKETRGRLDKTKYMEGWTPPGPRTHALYSANDILGAIEADQMGLWKYNMEIGGGFRRELCFRLAINLTYYVLTLNYKKDRAFPPVLDRRRRQ